MLNVQSTGIFLSAPISVPLPVKGGGQGGGIKIKVRPLFLQSRQFHTKMRTSDRIGPHNLDVVSVLVGCLLGDGYASQTKGKIVGTSFRFKQSGRHKDYLFFLYNFFLSPHPLFIPLRGDKGGGGIGGGGRKRVLHSFRAKGI